MSEKVMRIKLSELKTVRIKCTGDLKNGGDDPECGMIYEVAIEKLANAFPNDQCLRCKENWGPAPNSGPLVGLKDLAKVLIALKTRAGLEVEFDLSEAEILS